PECNSHARADLVLDKRLRAERRSIDEHGQLRHIESLELAQDLQGEKRAIRIVGENAGEQGGKRPGSLRVTGPVLGNGPQHANREQRYGVQQEYLWLLPVIQLRQVDEHLAVKMS